MKKILLILSFIAFLILGIGLYAKKIIYSTQITQNSELFITSQDTMEDLYLKLGPLVKNLDDVQKVIFLKKFTQPKPGRYILKKGSNTQQLVNVLRSGQQTPVKVTFNNQHYLENLAGRLSAQIEADSISILESLLDPEFLEKNQLNSKTVLNICMPYSYECYWNISPNQLRAKFLKAYHTFWNTQRLQKAKNLHLSQNQVISLAAIVQKESQHKPERKRIAGVYLNRIQKGMLLQADPTLIYAAKEIEGRNYQIKRVLNQHKTLESPYNTYKYKGIPPSAIAMPDVDAIEAVLNAEKHNYLFFCADTQKIGTHVFAKTYAQHQKNARRYYRKMNEMKIYK